MLALLLVVPLVGCADAAVEPAAQIVTHTVTATATETVTAMEKATVTAATNATEAAPEPTDATLPDATPTVDLPTFELNVLEGAGGCAVSRSEGDAPNLTWTVRDSHGVQVLGRNALGETTYGYFQPGTFTMVLQAWSGDRYVAVSNEVTINC